MNTYNTHTFKNGLELITVPMKGVKSATVMVLVGAGSRHEEARLNGISHFLEHMAFKGTKKRPSALVISSEIDALGGQFNAFTGKDHTGFYIKARVEKVPQLVDVLSDMLLHSLLVKEEVEREKGVIVEEINMYRDIPIRHIADVYEELIYGVDHPLGRSIAGVPETVRSFKRQDFVDYTDNYYRPNNAVIIVAGGVGSKSEIVEVIGKKLGGWKKREAPEWEKKVLDQVNPQLKLDYKDTQQAHLALGVHAYPHGHPRRFALSILSTILGGGMSSRLFIEVRERRGLGYYVRSGVEEYLDVGGFVVQAGVDVKRIDDAISVILEQLYKTAGNKTQIGKKELDKAKEYLKGKVTLDLEDSRAVASYYGTQEILERRIETPDEVFEKLDKVSTADLVDVAKEIFVKKHLNLAVIGPYKEPSRLEKLLE